MVRQTASPPGDGVGIHFKLPRYPDAVSHAVFSRLQIRFPYTHFGEESPQGFNFFFKFGNFSFASYFRYIKNCEIIF